MLNRIAAGVGAVVAVSLPMGVGAAVASADTGRHGTSSHARDGGHVRRDGHAGVTRDFRGGPRSAFQGGVLEGRERRDDSRGSARSRVKRNRDDDRRVTAADVDSTTPLTVSRLTTTRNLAVGEPATTSHLAAAAVAPAATARTAEERFILTTSRGGSSHLGNSVRGGTLAGPRVIFGDGRTPRSSSSGGPEELGAMVGVFRPTIRLAPVGAAQRPPAPEPSAPPAPAPAPAPPPIEWSPRTPITALWGRVEPAWPAGLLFGLAGLVLTPVGGIWLGHRQARASRAASQLVSH